MHPYLSEALAKIRIDELHREAALFRFAHQVGHRRRKAGGHAMERRDP
jgi:hypothetical protein